MGRKMLPKLSFVLGGAASGKSVFAENLILNSELSPVYIATSRVWDDETKNRVDIHKSRRDGSWTTVEASFDLAPALDAATPDRHDRKTRKRKTKKRGMRPISGIVPGQTTGAEKINDPGPR
jgi:hypothetical protein